MPLAAQGYLTYERISSAPIPCHSVYRLPRLLEALVRPDQS